MDEWPTLKPWLTVHERLPTGRYVYQGGSDATHPMLSIHVGNAQNAFQLYELGNATVAGTLTQNSNYRIKSDVVDIDAANAAANLRSVRPIEYNDNRDPSGSPRRVGMIAHELRISRYWSRAQRKPCAGHHNSRAIPPPLNLVENPMAISRRQLWRYDEPVLQNVNYIGPAPCLIAAWKHKDSLLERAMARIAELERKLSA